MSVLQPFDGYRCKFRSLPVEGTRNEPLTDKMECGVMEQ